MLDRLEENSAWELDEVENRILELEKPKLVDDGLCMLSAVELTSEDM